MMKEYLWNVECRHEVLNTCRVKPKGPMLKTSAKSCGVREMLAFHFAIPFVKGMVA